MLKVNTMINKDEYEPLIESIWGQVDSELSESILWQTSHLEFDDDDEYHEMLDYVWASVTDLLKYGKNMQD